MTITELHRRIAPHLLPPRPPISVAELAAHAAALARELSIQWTITSNTWDFRANSQRREITGPAIRSETDYCGILHEFGHCETVDSWRHAKSRYVESLLGGRNHVNTAGESAAWTWARAHALVWTPTMEKEKLRCLRTYAYYADGISDPIWQELDHINGRMTTGHAFLQVQRREMAERNQLIERWTKEIAMSHRMEGLEYADGLRRNLGDAELRKMIASFKRTQERRKRQGLALLSTPLFIAEAMQKFAEKR